MDVERIATRKTSRRANLSGSAWRDSRMARIVSLNKVGNGHGVKIGA